MESLNVKEMIKSNRVRIPRTQLDLETTMAACNTRITTILALAASNKAIAIEPVTQSLRKSVQEVGGYCCYANASALLIIKEMIPAVLALNETLQAIETDASKRARALLRDIVEEGHRWQQDQRDSAILQMGGQSAH